MEKVIERMIFFKNHYSYPKKFIFFQSYHNLTPNVSLTLNSKHMCTFDSKKLMLLGDLKEKYVYIWLSTFSKIFLVSPF